MNNDKKNFYNDFHNEKLKYKYKIADCDDITYKMNELHTPIKIVSILNGGNNNNLVNINFLIIIVFIILFCLYY